MTLLHHFFFAIFLLFPSISFLFGSCPWNSIQKSHEFSLNPEIYFLERVREGGTRQKGWMKGIRVSYEHIQRCSIYWGGHYLYGRGTLHGHNAAPNAIKSTFTDQDAEARLGFTFQSKRCMHPTIIPYLGYGYFSEINDFKSPSPVKIKLKTSSPYMGLGFISFLTVKPGLTIGFNFKGKWNYRTRCKIGNDPQFNNPEMIVENKINYRLELPIKYEYPTLCNHFIIGVCPFYERRHYGGRENFPFDFLDTKIKTYGIALQFIFNF